MVQEMAEEGRELEGRTHRGWQGHERRQGQIKGDDRTEGKAAETGSRRGAAGADRDLGSRARLEKQRV